eukprot:CAMPEP_0183381788 /NCGR_PEP_ID=MMETSP0164_2-20130417/126617_1 /TAXON_ID=221442 /ORGANISM="Coccolithus pelagicus ssp braarudi, Strain PLY182g" /LENGTH=32 /DNA_ID= /DNA_START= /DNA_END= /DNA_ORIENTATION=
MNLQAPKNIRCVTLTTRLIDNSTPRRSHYAGL